MTVVDVPVELQSSFGGFGIYIRIVEVVGKIYSLTLRQLTHIFESLKSL
jgi:hypothetical protein